MASDAVLTEGQRFGRFVIFRDTEGVVHAIGATSVAAVCEVDGDTLLLLPGGRIVRVERPLTTVLSWLETGLRGS